MHAFVVQDMSVYVRKVQFKLHESYPNPIRSGLNLNVIYCIGYYKSSTLTVLTKPPYEINETGWGEFEIVIKIYFMDSSEKPVRRYYKQQMLC